VIINPLKKIYRFFFCSF